MRSNLTPKTGSGDCYCLVNDDCVVGIEVIHLAAVDQIVGLCCGNEEFLAGKYCAALVDEVVIVIIENYTLTLHALAVFVVVAINDTVFKNDFAVFVEVVSAGSNKVICLICCNVEACSVIDLTLLTDKVEVVVNGYNTCALLNRAVDVIVTVNDTVLKDHLAVLVKLILACGNKTVCL